MGRDVSSQQSHRDTGKTTSKNHNIIESRCERAHATQLHLFHQQDFFGVVDLAQFDLNDFVVGGLNLAADECGLDRINTHR